MVKKGTENKWKSIRALLYSGCLVFLFYSHLVVACRKSLDDQEIYRTGLDPVRLSRLAPEIQAAIRYTGPWNQMLGVLVDEKKEAVAFGLEQALQRVHPRVADLKEWIYRVTGTLRKDSYFYQVRGKPVTIRLAPMLAGSAVHTTDFTDIDSELLVVVQYEGFKERHLHEPGSIAIEALVRFVQEITLQNMRTGFQWSDFKSGEYAEVPPGAEDTKSRAIKWSAEEVIAGQKVITDSRGRRKISLQQALASESRTKWDWLIQLRTPTELRTNTRLTQRLAEISVLMVLGGQNGSDTPVLRVARENHFPAQGATGPHVGVEGHTNYPPLRMTTICFRSEHLNLIRQVSVGAPAPDIFYTQAPILDAVRTHQENGDLLKVINRLAIRLFYWPDVMAFNPEVNAFQIYEEFEQILRSETVVVLRLLNDYANNLIRLRELNSSRDALEERLWKGVEYFFETSPLGKVLTEKRVPARGSIQTLRDFLEGVLQFAVVREFQRFPLARSYVDYVLRKENSFELEMLQEKPFFVSFKPDDDFVSAYSKVFREWQNAFPDILFSWPEDLHMTLAFVGRVTPGVQDRALQVIEEHQRNMPPLNFELTGGALQMVGSHANQVAIVFDSLSLPPALRDWILSLKRELVRMGVRPDDHLGEFLPHISIAFLGHAQNSDTGRRAIHELFSGKVSIPKKLRKTRVEGEPRILWVNPASIQVQQQLPRYIETATIRR